MNHKSIINVHAKNPPVVEMDSQTCAAYVRFTNKRVKETRVVAERSCTVTIDLDEKGEVIGVELIGVKEFSIRPLLKMAGITAPDRMIERASNVPAKLVAPC